LMVRAPGRALLRKREVAGQSMQLHVKFTAASNGLNQSINPRHC
jgi:hypothetical protein